jgi:hypothetical protein
LLAFIKGQGQVQGGGCGCAVRINCYCLYKLKKEEEADSDRVRLSFSLLWLVVRLFSPSWFCKTSYSLDKSQNTETKAAISNIVIIKECQIYTNHLAQSGWM